MKWSNENVLRRVTLAVVLGVVAFLLMGYAANAETLDRQETCPNTDFDPVTGGWVKVDGLDGFTYTFTDIPDGFEVTENCHKRATIVVYGTGPTVTSPDKFELSHASFFLVPKEVPPSSTTSTSPPDTTSTTVPETTTSSSTSTSTIPVTDSSTTTIEAPTTTPPTTSSVPPTVTTGTPQEQCSQDHPNWNDDTQSCELPFTGAGLGWWALAGALLTAAGLGMLAVKAER